MANIKGEIILPPIKTFTIEDSVKDQARKVLEESAELFGAVNDGMYNHAISEAMDTVQSICNLLEMLGSSDEDIERNYRNVVAKNKARGRYDG